LAGPEVRDVQVVFCDAIALGVDGFDLDVVRRPFTALVPDGDRKLAALDVGVLGISGERAERDVEFVAQNLVGALPDVSLINWLTSLVVLPMKIRGATNTMNATAMSATAPTTTAITTPLFFLGCCGRYPYP
jgi:hypothetical protein